MDAHNAQAAFRLGRCFVCISNSRLGRSTSFLRQGLTSPRNLRKLMGGATSPQPLPCPKKKPGLSPAAAPDEFEKISSYVPCATIQTNGFLLGNSIARYVRHFLQALPPEEMLCSAAFWLGAAVPHLLRRPQKPQNDGEVAVPISGTRSTGNSSLSAAPIWQ